MISGINKIIETIKIIIGKMTIGYNKVDKSVNINYTDNSTNIIYSGNIPLPPETILKLSNDELAKSIKDHTMLNLKTAYKDKPEEMKKYLKIYNPSALSIAGNTVTTRNLTPWLSGQTTVEPLGPMPSGDFIEQLPHAINISTPVDPIVISENIDIEIKDKNKN